MWNLCLSTNFRTRKLGEITGFFAVLSMNNNLVFKKKILNDNFEKGNCIWFRGSHRKCFVKKSVFKNFASLTVKHLCWNHFLIKLQASSNLKNICKQMLLLCSTGIYSMLGPQFFLIYVNNLNRISNILDHIMLISSSQSNIKTFFAFVKNSLGLVNGFCKINFG